MKLQLTLAATLLASLCLACAGLTGASVGKAVEFQLYSSNESLPPQYQRVTNIRGRINSSNVFVTYSFRDKDGQAARTLTLEGEQYRRCVEMVARTRIKVVPPSERPDGAASFDVTLVDADGKNVMGEPSNRDEWAQFAEDVRRAAD